MAEMTSEEIAALAEKLKTQRLSTEESLKQLSVMQEMNKALDEGILKQEREKLIREQSWELQKSLAEDIRSQLASGIQLEVIQKKLTAAQRDFLGITKEIVEDEEKLMQHVNEAARAADIRSDAQKDFNTLMSGTNKLAETSKKHFNAIAFAIAEGQGAAIGLQYAVAGFEKVGGMAWGKAKTSVIGLFTSFDELTKQFEKQYQLGPAYTQMLTDSYTEMTHLGVTIEDATKAYGALAGTVTDFTMMSRANQKAMGDSALLLERQGIAMGDFTQGVQNSIKFFGQGAQGAIQVQEELASTARALGRSPAELSAEFAAAGGSLAKFGDQGVHAFKELSRISKLTGMDVQKILNLTNKFDTFEDAAEMTGKLNAALGGNFVNAMDMMMDTDPVSRFESIRESLENAGLTFDDMSYYQKQFYTESLGLSDVGELAQLMSGDLEDLAGAGNQNAEELIAQKERAAELMTMQENLKATFLELGNAMLPYLDLLQGLAQSLKDNEEVVRGLIGVYVLYKAAMILQAGREAIGVYWTILSTAKKTLQAAASKLAGKAKEAEAEATKDLSDAEKEQAGAQDELGDSTSKLGQVAKMSAGQILALGGAMLLLGAGVALAALGMAQFVKAFSGFSAGEIIAVTLAIGGFMVGLYALATAMIAAGAAGAGSAAGMYAFGGAIIMVGAGVAIAALGVGAMALAFAEMFKVSSAEQIFMMMALMLAIGVFAWTGGGFIAAAGIFALALSFGALAFSLKFIATKDLEAIATFSESMAAMDTTNLRMVGTLLRDIAKSMDDIPISTTISLVTLFGGAEAASLAAEQLVRSVGVMTGIGPQAGSTPAAGALGAGGNAELTVNLVLDGTVIDKKILSVTQNYQGQLNLETVLGSGGTPVGVT